MHKILVVEPAPVDRKRIRSILEAAGHAVVEATSYAEAVSVLEGALLGSFRLIITELLLPTSQAGMDLIRLIRQRAHLQPVPLLVVTSQPPREMVIDLVTAGVSTIIAKPFGTDMLLRRVTEALANREVLRQGQDSSVSWQITDYVHRELKRSERSRTPFSVLVCRVRENEPKTAVATLMTALARLMRESDILAQLNGDHVVLLLPDTDAVGAWAVEDRIWQLVRQLEEGGEGQLPVQLAVSTGSAAYPIEAAAPEELISLAQARADRRAERA